jgi:hypothetical protein
MFRTSKTEEYVSKQHVTPLAWHELMWRCCKLYKGMKLNFTYGVLSPSSSCSSLAFVLFPFPFFPFLLDPSTLQDALKSWNKTDYDLWHNVLGLWAVNEITDDDYDPAIYMKKLENHEKKLQSGSQVSRPRLFPVTK